MADQTSIQYAGAPGSKLIFSGPPDRLQGTIPLTNPSSEKVKLRTLEIRSGALAGAAKLPLHEIPFAARFQPGQQARLQGTISVDPLTPPGTYDLELVVGGQTVAATAHVTDVVNFRIEPAQVTILSGSDGHHEREFVIENAGNVPLPLGERCEAPLLDSIDLVTSMLTGLRSAQDSDLKSKIEAWLNEWGQRVGGTLVVTREPIILKPGQKMTAKAQFQLPPDLKPFRHYRAGLQLYNASLSVDVYTTRKAGSNGSNDVPR